jgi:hypothetical protein
VATQPGVPPLRYLTASDVEAALPPVPARLDLAARAMRSLLGEAELARTTCSG